MVVSQKPAVMTRIRKIKIKLSFLTISKIKNQIGAPFSRALSPFGQPFLPKGLGRIGFLRLSGPAL